MALHLDKVLCTLLGTEIRSINFVVIHNQKMKKEVKDLDSCGYHPSGVSLIISQQISIF